MKNLLFLIITVCCLSCGSNDAAKPETTAKTTEPNIQLNKKTAPAAAPATQAIGDYKSTKEGWLVNLEEARAISEKTGKPILANFTGSDWCGWCKKLDKDVFNQPGFSEWAEKNVVLLELDFPRRTQLPAEIVSQNNGLKQAFAVRGFPTLTLFNLKKTPDGKMDIDAFGQTGYAKTLAEFQAVINKFIADKKKA